MNKIIYNIAKTVYAATTETAETIAAEVTKPFITLADIIIFIIRGVGLLVLIKGVIDIIPAIQDRDSTSIIHAGKTIAIGILLIFIKKIISLFYPEI